MNKNVRVKLSSGNRMPIIGLGTWQLTHDTANTVIAALKLGFRLIDTSSDYKTQPEIGKGIKRSGLEREEIFITTKVEENDNSYERIKLNLQELGLEYIDLVLIHRPPKEDAGQKLWQGMAKAKKEGLVQDIGVSNYSLEMMDRLIKATGEVPAVNQIEMSPFGFSNSMISYCKEKNIIIQAHSPLTRGTKLDDKVLAGLAEKYGKSPAQILIRWSLQFGSIPIPKANQKNHLKENIEVFDFEISQDDMDLLNTLNQGYSAMGSGLSYL